VCAGPLGTSAAKKLADQRESEEKAEFLAHYHEECRRGELAAKNDQSKSSSMCARRSHAQHAAPRTSCATALAAIATHSVFATATHCRVCMGMDVRRLYGANLRKERKEEKAEEERAWSQHRDTWLMGLGMLEKARRPVEEGGDSYLTSIEREKHRRLTRAAQVRSK
jgi:hypothetical protein